MISSREKIDLGEISREKELKREIGERVKKLEEEWKKWERGEGVKPPETPHFLLEKVLNKFIEGFKEKEYDPFTLGTFISGFINGTIDHYIKNEKEKGKKIDEIKEVPIRLNVKDLKYPLDSLGGANREKSHLTIYGDCGNETGSGMRGGQLTVGNCGKHTAPGMRGGTLIIRGKVEGFDPSAFSRENKGEIWHGEKIWPR